MEKRFLRLTLIIYVGLLSQAAVAEEKEKKGAGVGPMRTPKI